MTFGSKIVAWQRIHGRHDLPWQDGRDPYAIWISEIMLQQTQVSTVIPYYRRFMARFPDIAALGRASLDDVLTQWSGLGYYSRARNLHAAARVILDTYAGRFPATLEALESLPGIGRSTAAAIMVFAYGARQAILDGNVKRVLARVCGIAGFPGEKRVAGELWSAAERLLPRQKLEAYTQGLMDLGATVCLRRGPRCEACPVSRECVALRSRRIDHLPAPRPRKVLPRRKTIMLILEHRGELLLEKRPATGIWGGLWCFPELLHGEDAAGACAQRYGVSVGAANALPDVEHGFTHFSLTISPRRLEVESRVAHAGEDGYAWLGLEEAKAAAIPAPVKRILERL